MFELNLFNKKQRLQRRIDEFILNLLIMVKAFNEEERLFSGTKQEFRNFYEKYNYLTENLLQDNFNKFIIKFKDSISFYEKLMRVGINKTTSSKPILYIIFYLHFFDKLNVLDYSEYNFADILSEIKLNNPTEYMKCYKY